MKTLVFKWMMVVLVLTSAGISEAALISDAGTASTSEDSICPGNASTLLLTGYTGTIQWQGNNGSGWLDETGPGSTTDNYNVSPIVTTDYRAVVTDAGFPPDTSNVVTISVGVSDPVTTGDTRCGYGPVTLTASGSNIRWYDAPSGGSMLYNGSSFTTNVASTTTFYAAASSNGGGSASPALLPHSSTYTGYTRGYWFTAPVDFTITSLFVPTDASTDNQSIAVMSFPAGVPPPAGLNVFGFTTLFMSQNNSTPGPMAVSIPVLAGEHILIIGNRGSDPASDFAAINSYDGGAAYTTTIDGNIVDLNRGGMQSNLTGFDPQVVGVYIVIGTGQRGRVLFDYEVGCESSRIPAVATVTTAPSISIAAVPPALCQGQSSVITVSSSNSSYNYTWSPATGLSGTSGTTNTATPNAPITYTIIADDGTCGAIDSVFVDVGPASVAGTAAISSDTICIGTDAFLTLTGYTGNIQWQGNNGSGWIDETGSGNTNPNYTVSPPVNMQYRAIVTSGGCDPDTTGTLALDVLSIVDPATVNDTICAPGVANLSASGAGVLSWYTSPSGGTPVSVGNNYAPNISATTTYYVQASAGGIYPTGPANLGMGSQLSLAGNDFGLQFDVIQQCVLERVYVSPGIASGNITINLRDMQGGAVLNTTTVPVSAFSGLVPVNVGFTLNPGTAYRLELATGSVALYYNSTGATYPYTAPGSPVTITGAVNPAYNAGQYYYFFYNWEVKVGCSSNFVPVIAYLGTPPAVPTISQNGTILTSSASSGNQWYLNGNLMPGQTGTTLDMGTFGSGSYTVTVTIDGCSSTSLPVVYVGLNDLLSDAGINVFPNPVEENLEITFANLPKGHITLCIYDGVGKLLQTELISAKHVLIPWNYPAGSYSVEIKSGDSVYISRVVKL